jgi:hypothetical protein
MDCIPTNINQEQQKVNNIANEANLSMEELELQHKKRLDLNPKKLNRVGDQNRFEARFGTGLETKRAKCVIKNGFQRPPTWLASKHHQPIDGIK